MVKLTTAIVAFIWLVVTLDLTQAMWPPCNRTKNGKKIYHVFSHYKLSLRSRGGYCKVKVCDEIPKTPKYLRPDWTIKGLSVLQANGTEGPTWCMNVDYDLANLTTFLPTLELFWPSFDPFTTKETLWEDAVRFHGSCSICQDRTVNSTTDFIHFVLALNEMFNMSNRLLTAGILPSWRTPISLDFLKKQLDWTLWNDGVQFHCEGRLAGSDILQEIRICLNATKLMPTGCPPSETETCTTPYVWYFSSPDGLSTLSGTSAGSSSDAFGLFLATVLALVVSATSWLTSAVV